MKYVVAEADGNSVVQKATIKDTRQEAIDFALNLVSNIEDSDDETIDLKRSMICESGTITDGEWTISIVLAD